MDEKTLLLRQIVSGCYDLQAMRIQAGGRLVAQFRARLGLSKTDPATTGVDESEPSELETERAEKFLARIKKEYTRLSDAIATNKKLAENWGFEGPVIIHSLAELKLVEIFVSLEASERKSFKLLEEHLKSFSFYTDWLSLQKGIGPVTAGFILGWFSPESRHISVWWRRVGFDVVEGEARCAKMEHRVPRVSKKGKEYLGLSYDPKLRSKFFAVGQSMIKIKGGWVKSYYDYKDRLTRTRPPSAAQDPSAMSAPKAIPDNTAIKAPKSAACTNADGTKVWTKKHLHNAAIRYMLKIMLYDIWAAWRVHEGMPLVPTWWGRVMEGASTVGASDLPDGAKTREIYRVLRVVADKQKREYNELVSLFFDGDELQRKPLLVAMASAAH